MERRGEWRRVLVDVMDCLRGSCDGGVEFCSIWNGIGIGMENSLED